MPSVVDSTLARARRLLAEAGFREPRVDSLAPPAAAAGALMTWYVRDQSPKPGDSVLPSAPVRLLTRVAVLVPVPPVVGMGEEAARAELMAAGLRPLVAPAARRMVPVGAVVTTQSPRPDSLVAPATQVEIGISPALSWVALIGLWVGGAAIVIASGAGLTMLLKRGPLFGPRLVSRLEVEAPQLSWPSEHGLVRTEVSFTTEVAVTEPVMVLPQPQLIAREETVHE